MIPTILSDTLKNVQVGQCKSSRIMSKRPSSDMSAFRQKLKVSVTEHACYCNSNIGLFYFASNIFIAQPTLQ